MSVPSDAPRTPRPSDASPGTFVTACGVNAGGLFNSDNIIVAPGVTNGAHHFHDYVGNQANNGLATIDDLAKADTSCQDKGDKSSYYWPVLRLQNGTKERDADAPGGGTEGNAGQIVTPKQVTLTFVANPLTKVTPMPRLLRIITGDAKAFVNGPANANASWSCTGHEDRQLTDLQVPELLGRTERRQRQPPYACGVRRPRGQLPPGIRRHPATGPAHRLRRRRAEPGGRRALRRTGSPGTTHPPSRAP